MMHTRHQPHSSLRNRFCTIFTPGPDMENLRLPTCMDLPVVSDTVQLVYRIGLAEQLAWRVYRWKATLAVKQVIFLPVSV